MKDITESRNVKKERIKELAIKIGINVILFGIVVFISLTTSSIFLSSRVSFKIYMYEEKSTEKRKEYLDNYAKKYLLDKYREEYETTMYSETIEFSHPQLSVKKREYIVVSVRAVSKKNSKIYHSIYGKIYNTTNNSKDDDYRLYIF